MLRLAPRPGSYGPSAPANSFSPTCARFAARPRLAGGWHSAVALALLAPVLAVAQPVGPTGTEAQATLPISNEAMLLAGQARQAMEQGDYRLALALLERMAEHAGELVPVPPGSTYYPAWRLAARLLAQLPPEGLEVYRQLHDAEIQQRLAAAVASGDVATLRVLFRSATASTAWPEIGAELLACLLDSGAFSEAADSIRMMEQHDGALTPHRRAQLAVALARIGRGDQARRGLAELAGIPGLAQQPGWAERLAALERLIATGSEEPGPAGPAPPEPDWSAGALWNAPLLPESAAEYDDDATIGTAVDWLRRLPLHGAILAEEALIVRLRGTVWAFDPLTLCARWRAGETRAVREAPEEDWTALLGQDPTRLPGQRDWPVTSDTSELLSNALAHAVSAGFGLVYTIEPSAGTAPEGLNTGQAGLRYILTGRMTNELVARDLATGRQVWRCGGDPQDPLHNVAFLDAPIVAGALLAVPVQRGDELRLCLLEPASGRLHAEIPVLGPPLHSGPANRCALLADEASIYICTGNGVIAAVSREALEWKWASTYPGLPIEPRRFRPMPVEAPAESGFQPPVLAGDLLVTAPPDSAFLLAFDRFDGRPRWRVERGTWHLLLGAGPDGILVAGDALACLDPRDGQTLLWRSAPLTVTGRAAVLGGHVFVPTSNGLAVLDARSGKLLVEPGRSAPSQTTALAHSGPGEPARATGPVTANLVAAPAAVFAVSPNGIYKYPDPAATRSLCTQLLAADQGDARARLALAWLDRLAGDLPEALSGLETLRPDDPALASARETLLTDVFIQLSRRSDEHAARLAWLQRATQRAAAPETQAQLGLLIGRTLEELAAWDQAVAHYETQLETSPAVLVRDPDRPQRALAAWLHAATRLRRLHGPAAEPLAALTSKWLAAAPPDHLARLRLALPDGPADGSEPLASLALAVERKLFQSALAPELRSAYQPQLEDPELPAAEQRQLLLARWELDVALGRIAQARSDRQAWRAAETPSSAPASAAARPAGGDEPLARRVARVEAAHAKLEELTAPPLEPTLATQPCWKLQSAELILDTRRPDRGLHGWVPLRKHENRLLTLNSTILGRTAYQTRDSPQSSSSAADLRRAIDTIFQDVLPQWDEPPPFWPAAIYGHLAAVPVRGGLVCLGLGPGRSAGQRLWDLEVAEWRELPAGFGDLAVAGQYGVYLARRSDRLELRGWADGQVWWQYQFSGLHIRQLHLAGERLVLIGSEGAVLTLDAREGDDLQMLPASFGTPSQVAVAAETVVAWSERGLAGFDPATFTPRWQRSPGEAPAGEAGVTSAAMPPAADWVPVAGNTWLAWRDAETGVWQLLDAATGRTVFSAPLGNYERITAIAIDRGALLVAGFDPGQNPPAGARVRLAAFEPYSGKRQWECDLDTQVPVNLTQLLASPTFIPVLVARGTPDTGHNADYQTLTIRLIDRQTGERGESFPAFSEFPTSKGACTANLLATPERLIVQANGNLAAFGVAEREAQP